MALAASVEEAAARFYCKSVMEEDGMYKKTAAYSGKTQTGRLPEIDHRYILL